MTSAVSVVIATYNYGRYLAGAVQSALDQTFTDLEVIVLDDGSTDDTPEVLAPFLRDQRVRYQRQEHRGVSAAKSAGVRLARAPLVAFLDADDWWFPQKLERQLPLFHEDVALGVVYSRRLLIDPEGELLVYQQPILYRGNVLEEMIQLNFVCFSSAVVRRAVFDEVGLFDERLPFAVDYDLWLRVALRYRFDYVDEPLVKYRTGHANLSSREVERTIAALGILDRFLDKSGRAAVRPAVIRQARAVTCASIALAVRSQSRLDSLRWNLWALALAPTDVLAWKMLASLVLPGAARGWLRRLLGKPSWEVRQRLTMGARVADADRPRMSGEAPFMTDYSPSPTAAFRGAPAARTGSVSKWRGAIEVLAHFPWLVWRSLRWHMLRGRWLPSYLWGRRAFDVRRLPPGVPVDIMVVCVDHFEPLELEGDAAAVAAVNSWCTAYRTLAERHRDHDGRYPQHTWFYRAEYPNRGCLQVLADSAYGGFGEVEFHLHHGPDTEATFATRLRTGLDWFNQSGAMLTAEQYPRQRFAYIAGNWALDNGAGDDTVSGCNTELIALRQAGCYADFTFPALGSPAQPRKINALYYATDDPKPKSYDRGIDLEVGRPPSGDLLIFQGPLTVDWQRGSFEGSALELFAPPSPDRLDLWLKPHIHVRGRPEWVFIKLHTHGMQSRDVFLGPDLDALFTAMETRWTQPPFRLHYVTAREAYNIARAAEAGHRGNPNDFRDYEVAPPANRLIRCSSPWRLLYYSADRLSLEVLDGGPVTIECTSGPLRKMEGHIRRLDAWFADDRVAKLAIDGDGPFQGESVPPIMDVLGNGADGAQDHVASASGRSGTLETCPTVGESP
jgi:glycosyltransferase involved in cell wall biosynthesis